MDKPQTFTAKVSSVTQMAGVFYVARFALAQPKEIQFQAGQYVIFKIGPPKVNHTLSIASPPAAQGSIEILQSVAPMGGGSKWLLACKPGDTVQFIGPLGKFTLQKENPRQKVFVATGCGLGPLRSMTLDYLGGGGTAPVTLWWGLRYETDVFWQEELAALAARYSNFHYTITLSKPTDGWQGSRGRVTAHVVGETPELTASEFYLCGSREMIVDTRRLLTQNGVPNEQIFTETFF
ncbi:hypothetical protein HY411_02270 [Candidatus Gottesmanbacteria bacterium]|nr:hypothetical protein [Candidatus Gottesmanbacteria bacterium]